MFKNDCHSLQEVLPLTHACKGPLIYVSSKRLFNDLQSVHICYSKRKPLNAKPSYASLLLRDIDTGKDGFMTYKDFLVCF